MLSFHWKKSLIATILIVALSVIWHLTTLQTPGLSQDTSFLASRVDRVETENSALRSRISRLESEIARLNNRLGIEGTYEAAPIEGGYTGTLAEDPTFQRLATLVIELRDRIIALENQVTN